MPVAKQAKDEKEWSHGDFSREELIHYSRHLLLADLGLEGQKRLKKASVLVVGAGGLGLPSAAIPVSCRSGAYWYCRL
jgi:tRNA A37 threonylcarbamoyladenosine dehydratase